MIKDAVEKAQDFINRHKLYLSTIKYEYWIFFNKEGKPYIGIQKDKYLDYNNIIDKEILLYDMDCNYYIAYLNRERQAKLRYAIYSQNKKLPCLKLHYIHATESQKGLSSQLMAPIILETEGKNNGKVEIEFIPFDHGLKNVEKVINFYKKFKFDINENARKLECFTAIYNKEDVKNSKLKLINYPTQNYNFKVIIPEKFLEYSSFKEEDLSK